MTTTSAASALTSATATSGAASSDPLASLTSNFDSFLQLLIQQLKNQDPTSPMDPNQFTTQLVQFAGVEQSIQQNKQLGQLVGLQQTNSAASAVSYIGRTIEADGATTDLANGQATWSYTLPATAAQGALVVTDSSGKNVRQLTLDPSAGTHSVTWDGKDDVGNTRPDGLYTLNVVAADSAGNALAATTTTTGVVSAVSNINGTVMLTVGGRDIPITAVTKVVQPVS